MNKTKGDFPYIHGFSKDEQERLVNQARFTEPQIYNSIDFSKTSELLEVGGGVGAQTEILLRRFPDIHVSSIDLNTKQIESAKKRLKSLSFAKGRYENWEMDASKMTFEKDRFDGAFVCWVLEHVPHPRKILKRCAESCEARW